jgi:hypothetical protein
MTKTKDQHWIEKNNLNRQPSTHYHHRHEPSSRAQVSIDDTIKCCDMGSMRYRSANVTHFEHVLVFRPFCEDLYLVGSRVCKKRSQKLSYEGMTVSLVEMNDEKNGEPGLIKLEEAYESFNPFHGEKYSNKKLAENNGLRGKYLFLYDVCQRDMQTGSLVSPVHLPSDKRCGVTHRAGSL